MDTDGHIRELMDGEKHRNNEVPLDKLPNPKCPDCYGRGFQRFLIENITETRPCHCTKQYSGSFSASASSEFIKGWNAALDAYAFMCMGWSGDLETMPSISDLKKKP